MGLFSGLKRIVDKGLHIVSPRQFWSSGARHRSAQDLSQMLGTTIGGIAQSLNPNAITGEILHPDQGQGESRGKGLVKALELALMAASAGGYGPFSTGAKAGTAAATASKGAQAAQAASQGASAPQLAGLQRVAASAGHASQIPASLARSFVRLYHTPVGQTDLHGLLQAHDAAQIIGRPVTERANIHMLNRQADQQRQMYLAWLARQQRPVFQRQPANLMELLAQNQNFGRAYNGFA